MRRLLGPALGLLLIGWVVILLVPPFSNDSINDLYVYRTFAAPVLDESGRAIAALSVSGPTLRLSPRRVAELRPIVIKQARALAEQLGHRTEGVHAA